MAPRNAQTCTKDAQFALKMYHTEGILDFVL